MIDRLTGGLRGAVYVRMDSQNSAQRAIAALNGRQIAGCNLVVNKNWGKERVAPKEPIGRTPQGESLLVVVAIGGARSLTPHRCG